MLRNVLPYASLFLPTALALPATKVQSRQSSNNCVSGVHVIAASGDGAQNVGGYGLLGSLATSIVNAIPDSDQVSLPYPKADPSGLNKIAIGGPLMVDYITDYAASCPDTKIVILGYSAGGVIAFNALCGSSPPWSTPASPLDPSLNDNILGVIGYGDTAHSSVSPFNAGTCMGDGRFPRTGQAALCPAFAPISRRYCNTEDPECCQGGRTNAHFEYPEQYDADATAFIVDLFEQAGAPQQPAMPELAPPQMENPPAPSEPSPEPSPEPVPAPEPVPSPPSNDTPAPPPAPAPDVPLPSQPEAPITTPDSNSKSCPLNLDGTFSFPHLIVPISESSPNTAYGTQYNGKVTPDVSSIFNFDLPQSYGGKTCSLIFSLPEQGTMQWSSYTTSGSGGISVSSLEAPADLSTSFANAPNEASHFGTFEVPRGGAKTFATGPCAAGKRVGYKLAASGDYSLDYFQASGEPIGLYMTTC